MPSGLGLREWVWQSARGCLRSEDTKRRARIYFFFFDVLCYLPQIFFFNLTKHLGTSLVAQGLRIACQCRGHGFEPWSGKIPHAEE